MMATVSCHTDKLWYINLLIIIKTSSLLWLSLTCDSSPSNQHQSQTHINVIKTRIYTKTPSQVRTAHGLRCSSPGWTPSLLLLRLLSRLRFRAPAASSGSGPAGKPAPPATPAPPRSPPASDRDASFCGQGEPAAAPAALAAVVRSTSPREARGSERTSASCGGVGGTPSAARVASLSVGPCLSHAHTSTRARWLERFLGTPDSHVRARLRREPERVGPGPSRGSEGWSSTC